MTLGTAAAALPWPVFACDSEKRPVIATGFKAATRDHNSIITQFDRPGAEMIGVPTGQASGIIVIDVDIKTGRDGRAWLLENRDALPQTRTHKTRSGGLHLLFLLPPDCEIRNSAGRIAMGIDVRGEGGYIIVPPSPGYAVADTAEPAEMPRWLIRACLPEQAPQPPPARPHARHEKYTQAAIDGEVLTVLRAGEGTRNDTLNKAAFKLGTLIAAGQMARGDAEAELQRAGQMVGLDARETAATIKSGLDSGMRHPREMPEREPVNGTHRPSHAPEEPQAKTKQDAPASEPPAFLWAILEPWAEADIPCRPWLARGYLMRGAITVLSGAPSAGKSSTAVAWACAAAVGCSFNRMRISAPLKVATYNVEDDANEQKRRFSATLTKLGLTPAALAGHLAILGPNQVGTLLQAGRDGGVMVNTKVMENLITFLDKFRPDILILDPFVELHSAEENDNTAVRAVMATFRTLAIEYELALVLLHHARKGLSSPGDPDSLRGASAIVGAARIALTVNVMTEEEAGTFGISKDKRRNYFRLDTAKSNYAPIEDAEWFQREEVRLSNGANGEGDGVAVSWPWKPPNVWQTSSPAVLNAILDDIAAAPEDARYGKSAAGKDNHRWVGHVIMRHLSCNQEQAKVVVSAWLKNGLLVEEVQHNAAQRKPKPGLVVVDSLRPT